MFVNTTFCTLVKNSVTSPTDGLESYLMHQHWVDGDDGQVLILSSRAHQYHPLCWLSSSNLLMIQPPEE